MSKNFYIVPHDFTELGDIALSYAIQLCKSSPTEIQILHISASKSDVQKANAKLDQIIETQKIPSNITLSKSLLIGSIFDQIGQHANKSGAQLIIMGTHGMRGMQRVFGSHAMKVITSCDIPFLVVQKETTFNDINHIVVPIDLTKESLQIVNIAGDLANKFDATVHVIGEKQNDDLLSQQMKNRILIVKNQYEEKNVKCEVEFIKESGSYVKKILNYAKAKNIDVIAISYHSESLMPQFDTFAPTLMNNEMHLPCLLINSKLASALYF